MSKGLLLFFFLLAGICGHSQTDTLMSSVNAVSGNTDSNANFFARHEKIDAAQWTKTRLTTRARKNTTLHALLNDPDKTYPDHVIADLDGDGKKELVVSIFTGGAHCCDEITIFREVAPGRYTHAAKVFAGHTLFTPSNQLVYTLYEPFGYFFTCYACGLADTSDAAPIDIHAVILQYSKGKLRVKQGDPELRSAITDNLGKLSEMPYERLDEEILMDSGLRKEFAMNLAVYYFSFGRNLTGTKALFNKYYRFPDAGKVWAAFAKQLRKMQADNDF